MSWKNAPIVEKAGKPQRAAWESAPIVEDSAYDTYIKPAAQAVGSVARGAYDLVAGKHDPRFEGLPSIDEPAQARAAGFMRSPTSASRMERAKMFGLTDAQYRDILVKQLQDSGRFIGVQKDANGYDVLSYRDDNGRVQQAYVNKPGLDYRDVDRGIQAALPYMVGGGAAGALVGKAPLIGQAVGQGLGAFGTSILQDAQAQRMGSQQGIDPGKALGAGAGGLLGQFASAGLARALGPKTPRVGRVVDDAGNLTEKGQRQLAAAGQNVDSMSPEAIKQFGKNAKQTDDVFTNVTQAKTQEFGIPSTLGQRTKNPAQILREKEMRLGHYGDTAQAKMTDLDRLQGDAVEAAIFGTDRSVLANDARRSIGGMINPARPPKQQHLPTIGENIKRGQLAGLKAAKNIENQYWNKVGRMTPRAGANDSMPDFIARSLGNLELDRELTPAAAQMARQIRAFKAGDVSGREFSDVVKQEAVEHIDGMRRKLLKTMGAAQNTTDRQAANRVYGGFLDWVDDAAGKQLLTGDAAAAQAMRNAMKATREIRNIIQPRDKRGLSTPAARILTKLESASTGEEALKAVLGSAGPSADLPFGAVEAVQRLRATMNFAGDDAAKQAWNDLRMAHWLRLITDKDGSVVGKSKTTTFSPNMVNKRITQFLRNQNSMATTLYTEQERDAMRSLANAMRAIDWESFDFNPSGTGSTGGAGGIAERARGFFTKTASEAAKTQSKRELFSKHNVMLSRFYGMLAMWIKMSDRPSGRAMGNLATSQALPRKRAATIGGVIGAAGGAQAGQGQLKF